MTRFQRMQSSINNRVDLLSLGNESMMEMDSKTELLQNMHLYLQISALLLLGFWSIESSLAMNQPIRFDSTSAIHSPTIARNFIVFNRKIIIVGNLLQSVDISLGKYYNFRFSIDTDDLGKTVGLHNGQKMGQIVEHTSQE